MSFTVIATGLFEYPEDMVLLFHEARLVVESGYPELAIKELEVVGACLTGTETMFALAHQPDGPWLAVCPIGDDALDAIESPTSLWAERQQWSPFFRMRGHEDARGDWWVEAVEV